MLHTVQGASQFFFPLWISSAFCFRPPSNHHRLLPPPPAPCYSIQLWSSSHFDLSFNKRILSSLLSNQASFVKPVSFSTDADPTLPFFFARSASFEFCFLAPRCQSLFGGAYVLASPLTWTFDASPLRSVALRKVEDAIDQPRVELSLFFPTSSSVVICKYVLFRPASVASLFQLMRFLRLLLLRILLSKHTHTHTNPLFQHDDKT